MQQKTRNLQFALKRTPKSSYGAMVKKDFFKHWQLYLIFLPVLIYYILFCYGPMYGILAAFQRYNVRAGIAGSTWIGLQNFRDFFGSYYFLRILKNTLVLNISDLIFAWPCSIIFALLLNEVGNVQFKRSVQTLTYLPYFISTVVAAGIIIDFTNTNGLINDALAFFGMERQSLLANKGLFPVIYVFSNIWQATGYGSIIYVAAIGGVNTELYEAAMLDGAGRLRQAWHVTLPGISPTIITLFIMRVGNILTVSFEKILLLQNAANQESSEVIATFVYKKGLIESVYGYSTAVGVFNSIISLIFLFAANTLSRKFSETSLW